MLSKTWYLLVFLACMVAIAICLIHTSFGVL